VAGVISGEREVLREATDRISESVGPTRRWDGATIRFVEHKPLDLAYVDSLLRLSRDTNHWTNFGPVSLQLEHEIAARLDLGPSLRVVMCSSGTQALHALIGMHETLADRPLRWATSAFGYYCSVQGPLANAHVVDCDEHAMLPIDAIDVDAVDGFIVTNAFGLASDLGPYAAFAERHGKILVVDAAMAYRSHAHGPNEIISFHHTKPWGYGEGGCAIVAADHERQFRSLISLGHLPDRPINRRATNAKASDLACAFQAMRLRDLDHLELTYREQYRRIASLGLEAGFEVLAGVNDHPSIPGNVPLLAPRPFDDVRHPVIPTGRYYHPLDDTPRARSIFERIVNIPCHPGMASLDDEVVSSALLELRRRAG
jgi:dTDP-4-amino-4,6-dideoxygalactose transaminase